MKLLKLKKVTIPAAILIIVAGISVYFSDRLVPFIVINYSFSKTKTPEMYIVPTLREVQHFADNYRLDYDLSFKSIKFKAPWELREKIELDYATLFAFVNKKGLELMQQKDDEKILKGLLEDDQSETLKLKFLFGEENLESEYAFVNLILHTTPDQADLFKPLPELLRIHPLLLYKLLYPNFGGEIYKFNINDFKVFQFGNPQNTEHVRAIIFDRDDQVFKFHFVKMTQVEIDLILSTIEFI